MNVLLVIVLLFCVCFLCVALAPLRVRAEFSLDGRQYEYGLTFSWLHPALLRGAFSSTDPRLRVKVLFWDIPTGDAPGDGPLADGDTQRGTEAPSRAPEPAATPSRPVPAPPPMTAAKETPSSSEPDMPREEPSTAQPQPPRARKVPAATPQRKPSAAWFFLLQGAWRRKLLRCVFRTLAGFFWPGRITHLAVAVRGGNGDPCATAIAAGAVNALAHALQLQDSRRFRVTYEPVFDQPSLHVQGHLQARTSASRLWRPVVNLLVSFPYVATLVTWVRWRRARRKAEVSPA